VPIDELGLFPLGVVLLPTERIPLHIFEPRYRELINECIDEDTEFGLVFADEDGVRELGTRALVTDVLERFDDGRLNIVVEGQERFHVERLTQGRSFMTAIVAPVAETRTPGRSRRRQPRAPPGRSVRSRRSPMPRRGRSTSARRSSRSSSPRRSSLRRRRSKASSSCAPSSSGSSSSRSCSTPRARS